MPTNEERREVAKELRYAASHSLNGYSFQRAVEGMVFGALGDRPWRETLNRLADLIEPEERTCHVINSNSNGDGKCDACEGKASIWDDYCKRCGAKVVEE